MTKFVKSGVPKTFSSRTTGFNSTISLYHQIVGYLNIEAGIGKNLSAGLNYIIWQAVLSIVKYMWIVVFF